MEILQLVQNRFKCVAITLQNSKKCRNPLKRRMFVVFCVFLLFITFNIVYFTCVAENFMEISQSIFMVFSSFTDLTLYSLYVWNAAKWTQFIARLERFTNKSNFFNSKKVSCYGMCFNSKCLNILGLKYPKSKEMYVKTNQQVEKWSKIFNFTVGTLCPAFILLPNVIESYFNYFVNNWGNDSFEFTIPTW